MSTTFQSVSYGPCSRTGVTCVAFLTGSPSQRDYKKMTPLTSSTEMTISQIVELLDFCLNTTYFIYDGAYYQQTHGAAMGSSISPLVANCYMEQFEKVAISTAPHPHHCGYDTWTTHSLYFTNTMWKSSLNT